jgi:formylglycine-generating enzyme required for sulfatase activity
MLIDKQLLGEAIEAYTQWVGLLVNLAPAMAITVEDWSTSIDRVIDVSLTEAQTGKFERAMSTAAIVSRRGRRWYLQLAKQTLLSAAVSLLTFAVLMVGAVYGQQVNTDPSGPPPGSSFHDCSNCPEMVVIPSGSFLMGSSSDEAERDVAEVSRSEVSFVRKALLTEQPQHRVEITRPFALAKFPVTKGGFAAFVNDTGYTTASGCSLYALHYHEAPDADWRSPGFSQADQEPVVCVTWRDAKAYIGWLNQKLVSSAGAELYRLPSEAEWEYAARAGTQTSRWWGDAIGRNNTDCARCGSPWDQEKTAPVGSFHPNPFGLYDVLGNVAQWTDDCWNENYTDAPADGSPWLTGDCKRRVARGGDWANFPWVVRSGRRSGFLPDAYNFVGFRVAKSLRLIAR